MEQCLISRRLMRETFEGTSLARQTSKRGIPGLEYSGPSVAAWQSDDYSSLV